MWVVKLGGSLDGAGTLKTWVATLAACDVPLIICPGGGVFADQVRGAQRRWHIDDITAHRMAILAMEQTAHLLCGLGVSFNPVSRLGSLQMPRAVQRPAVWFPASEWIDDTEIPSTWNVTSDSLAAVLARRIGACGLVLIKSAPLPEGPTRAAILQGAGFVDAAFDGYGSRSGCPVWLLSGGGAGEFRRLLVKGEGGCRVLFDTGKSIK